MYASWLTRVIPIAGIFACRMLGLFMLIPVFTVEAPQLTGATPLLIGIALGGYGLTQGILQIPFGLLSDRFGRKPLLLIGLLCFTLGSLWGVFTTSITGMIGARLLQGAGAIGSVLMALVADVTPEEVRTKAMAIIGMSIGLSFGIAMMISPGLTAHFGLSGLFVVMTILAILGLVLVQTTLPAIPPTIAPPPRAFLAVLRHRHLQRLNVGIFCQHAILTATFFAVPMLLKNTFNEAQHTSFVYAIIMIGSFAVMMPSIMFAEKHGRIRTLLMTTLLGTGLTQVGMLFLHKHKIPFFMLLFLYFVCFQVLEAILPSLTSKAAPKDSKGAAMGLYASSQFLGIFFGGLIAGLLYTHGGMPWIFAGNTLLVIGWVIFNLL